MMWLQSLWHFVFGWPTIDALVGAAAIAIAVLEPPVVAAIIPDLRKWAIAVAVVAFTFLSISGKFYHDGIAEKQRQWDSALENEIAAGGKARSDAVATVGPVPSDRGMFRGDPNNRDGEQPSGDKPSGPVRWLGSHHLFGN